VSEAFGRKVSAGNVEFLVERKLRPLGVLAQADDSPARVSRRGSRSEADAGLRTSRRTSCGSWRITASSTRGRNGLSR
jgi:hypothetical protein